MADLFDLQHRSKTKNRPQPYPRPWSNGVKRIGTRASGLTNEGARAILKRAARG